MSRRVDKGSTRTTYHHGNLRQALLDAALEALATTSAESISLRELARRVGVDHRAAYRHFADKDSLLAVVAEEGYRSLLVRVQREMARHDEDDTIGRLRSIARAYVLFASQHPSHYRVMSGPRLNELGRFPGLEPVLTELFDVVEGEVKAGITARRLSPMDTRQTTVALWATVHGLSSLVLARRVRVPKEKLAAYADAVVDRMLLGISA
jgi:AcrR family transcriptional regulator